MRMRITVREREFLRNMFGGRCAYCGSLLPEREWHAAHIESIYQLNGSASRSNTDNRNNLFPSCRACNLFKSVYSIEAWRKEIKSQVERARKRSFNFRTAERFGLISETYRPVIFYFERVRDGAA